MKRWWRRRRREVRWSTPDRVPDGDTVPMPGYERWTDLLHPDPLREPTRLIWPLAPLLTQGDRWRAEPHRIRQRLDELQSLPDLWVEGKGRRPATNVLRLLHHIAGELVAPDLPTVHILPTPGGGVQLEWRSGSSECCVEIHPDLSTYAVQADVTGEVHKREHSRFDKGVLLTMLRDGIAS